MSVTSKKPAKKKTQAKSTSASEMRSFRLYPGEKPFFTLRINQQTFYWLIIGILVLGLGIWTTFLSLKLQAVYDRIEVASIVNQ